MIIAYEGNDQIATKNALSTTCCVVHASREIDTIIPEKRSM